MTRPTWDFEYLPLWNGYRRASAEADFVIATRCEVPVATLSESLGRLEASVVVDALFRRAPLFWYRVRFENPQNSAALTDELGRAGVDVRFVTSSTNGNMELGTPLDFSGTNAPTAVDWKTGRPPTHRSNDSEGRWFLGSDAGVDTDPVVCGSGGGTRLAVIDDEAREIEALELDRAVMVGIEKPPHSLVHGAAMVAWAVGTRGDSARGIPPFSGVAPHASPRLYVIPKPGRQVIWLPLAIARAVEDGADVVICSTYIEGTTSPLLDDALAFASISGRGGLGTAVFFPTGREISSPNGSLHASLTLAVGEPATDPRVFCVAPSGKEGGWFLWTDKRGKKKPFANRGPNVRGAAPGDDVSYPFTRDDRLGHAESSGAAAVAAGVALLVLSTNPLLPVSELYAVLCETAERQPRVVAGPIADPADLLPSDRDVDGHDAKTGYGRLSARRACLSVADPIAAALLAVGSPDAAERFVLTREQDAHGLLYSEDAARWAVLVARRDPAVSDGLSMLARHFRLLAGKADRQECQRSGATLRAVAILIQQLTRHDAPPEVKEELSSIRDRLFVACRSPSETKRLEDGWLTVASGLWTAHRSVRQISEAQANRSPLPVGAEGRSA